jgi:hypothetical protein
MKKVATLEVIERVDSILDRMAAIGNNKEKVTMDGLNALYKEYDEIWDEYDFFDQVFEENGMLGVRNVNGKVLVPALYKNYAELYAYSKSEQHRPVPACDSNGKYALVACDGKGTPLCTFEYDMLRLKFGGALLYQCWKRVGEKTFVGVIDGEGNVIVPCEMDEIYGICNNFAVIDKGDKVGAVTTGGLYIEPLYDDLEESGGFLTACKDGVWGYISAKGEFIDMADEERLDSEEWLSLFDY